MNAQTPARLVPLLFVLAFAGGAHAQMMRPPSFIGGVPGMAQFQAMTMQRHQARTLLYREALEELRKNPTAADVPECPAGGAAPGVLCLKRPEPAAEALPVKPSTQPVATATPAAAAPIPQAVPQPTAPKQVPAQTPAPQATPTAQPVAVAQPTPPAIAAAAPAPTAAKPVAAADSVPAVRKRIAVLVGNNDYKMPIPGLDTPIADVEKIADVLRSRFGYEAHVVKNASKAQIIEALNRVATDAKPEDSVLLFYAGHGYLMDDTKMGFWIPIDASVKTAANWISNTDISKLLAAIPSRQLILVSDSCFSGSLTKEQKVTYSGKPKPEEVLRRRSVLVFSSGGDEPVSDEGKEGHSIFAWNLIKTLDTATGTTPGYDVWKTVHGRVTKEFPQEPQYGAVVSAGHAEGGEYLFQPR
ncbi:hypothetical protein RHDC4_01414 [Rhodocyclaceae bacterium]|nr:hypothetical protein RHDC4_01414 [Rhodocyclaceae bacterium]